jgi:hypothetical protein
LSRGRDSCSCARLCICISNGRGSCRRLNNSRFRPSGICSGFHKWALLWGRRHTIDHDTGRSAPQLVNITGITLRPPVSISRVQHRLRRRYFPEWWGFPSWVRRHRLIRRLAIPHRSDSATRAKQPISLNGTEIHPRQIPHFQAHPYNYKSLVSCSRHAHRVQFTRLSFRFPSAATFGNIGQTATR